MGVAGNLIIIWNSTTIYDDKNRFPYLSHDDQ